MILLVLSAECLLQHEGLAFARVRVCVCVSFSLREMERESLSLQFALQLINFCAHVCVRRSSLLWATRRTVTRMGGNSGDICTGLGSTTGLIYLESCREGGVVGCVE